MTNTNNPSENSMSRIENGDPDGEEKLPSSINDVQSSEQQNFRVYSPKSKPVVVYTLMGISVIVFIIQIITQYSLGFDLPLQLGAKYGPLIYQYGQWWRLITPIFLHGSIMHILFNMYALFTIGPELEKFYGHLDFLLFYLITGFCGNVFSYVFSPNSVSVGASTSLFGLIAAQGFIVFKNKKMIHNYKRVMGNIIMVVAVNLLLGMQNGIDNWGHLGGLVGGSLISFLSCPVITIHFNPKTSRLELFDSVSKKSRYISYAVCTLFFVALTVAFHP